MSKYAVIRAYVKKDYPKFRQLYLEKEKRIDNEVTAVASLYRLPAENKILVLGTIINKGDYMFFTEDYQTATGIMEANMIGRIDYCSNVLERLDLYNLLKSKMIGELINNPKLPSILSVGTANGLTIYYTVNGTLETSTLYNGCLTVSLPESEFEIVNTCISKLGIVCRNTQFLEGNKWKL